MKRIILIAITCIIASCGKYEYPVFDQFYVSFVGATSYNIDPDAMVLNTYNIRLCAPVQKENVDIQLSVEAGEGLKEGVDYKLVSKTQLSFLPGVYSIPFRIQWLRNDIDESKDCTLTVSISSCSLDGVLLGIPGPDARGRKITISKTK